MNSRANVEERSEGALRLVSVVEVVHIDGSKWDMLK